MATRRRAPKDDSAEIEAAEEAGHQYVRDQLQSDYFDQWVWDQMVEAEEMRQRDPSSVIPLESESDYRKVARNMLQQLGWDIRRDIGPQELERLAGGESGVVHGDAFFEGMDGELRDPNTVSWLVDKVRLAHEQVTKPEPQQGLPGVRAREAGRRRRQPPPDYSSSSAHAYNIEVLYPDERFARKHESQIGHIIQKPLVSQGALLDGYRMEYGPIDRGDYRRLEGAIYSKLGNAVRVRLVQVMYGGGGGGSRGEQHRVDPQTWAESRATGMTPEQRAAVNAALQRYGASLTDDDRIAKGEKVLSVRVEVQKGRLRMVGPNDNLVASFPASRVDAGVADFVEKFWFWKPVSVSERRRPVTAPRRAAPHHTARRRR